MTGEDLTRLLGLGPRSTAWLAEIGITSYDEIDELGSAEVYRRLRAARDGVSLNMLWALESLLIGCHWRDLPADRKAALRAEVADG